MGNVNNNMPRDGLVMAFVDRHVLLLNANWEVLDVITWQKAVCLMFRERVIVKEHFEDSVIRSANSEMKMPKIMALQEFQTGYHKNAKKYVKLNKRNVLLRDNHTCMYCGKALTDFTGTQDHVMPLSRKGKNSWDNVVAACGKCNKKKNDRTPEEAGMKLLRKPFLPSKQIFYGKYLKKPEYESWKEFLKKDA